MVTENNIHDNQYYYQKGYANGFKRYRESFDSQKDNELSYIYTVLTIIVIFIGMIGLIVMTYGSHEGMRSNYKDDCLNY
jgi:hypothetical protein